MITTMLLLASLAAPPAKADFPAPWRTVAERSGFTETATYDETVQLMTWYAEASPHIRLDVLGQTFEGREIPIAIVGAPPVADAAAARSSGKPIVFIFANIHAGEVCGKEAALMLLREIATAPPGGWLEDLVIVIAPIYNADGNERFSPDNRPGQNGPKSMGQRPNAQGFDLNRDYVKLDAPETRALVRFLTDWDPHLTVDCHTTNGSHHRYTLTYDTPLNPAGAEPPRRFLRETLLPEITEQVKSAAGYDLFWYGNFNRDHTAWYTYSALPRYGANYQGLRGQMQLLSEAYSYATFEDRVKSTLAFLRSTLDRTRTHAAEMIALHEAARADVVERGRTLQPDDVVGIRFAPKASPRPARLKGYVMTPGANGRMTPTEEPTEHLVVHVDGFESTRSVRRPRAYLIPPEQTAVLDLLALHGVRTEPASGTFEVETYQIDSVTQASRRFQGRQIATVEATARSGRLEAGRGWVRVPMDQPLGNLIVNLLEPEAADGFAAWDVLGDAVRKGRIYPIRRERP